VLTAHSASYLQVTSSVLDAEPATRERDTSCAFSSRDTHKAELHNLGEEGKARLLLLLSWCKQDAPEELGQGPEKTSKWHQV